MKYLVVIDMQNDFINGSLGTKEAEAVVEKVKNKIDSWRQAGGAVIFTRDTHDENYMNTQEGRKLPVPHCLKNTDGWQISAQLSVLPEDLIIDKPTFGSTELAAYFAEMNKQDPSQPEEIQLVGLCTDICVISNAMLLKAALTETPVVADSRCCAGVTPESHQNALAAMKMCQIDIIE